MRIAIIVEGGAEKAFLDSLRRFLGTRLVGGMPRLVIHNPGAGGRIPKGDKLRRTVELLLRDADHVVALTDVYTGTNPPDFLDAADAKAKMRHWAGDWGGRFHAHAAQYEFEAWLIPYWDRIRALSGSNRAKPDRSPENINHGNPPSRVLEEVFRPRRAYRKTVDSRRILDGQDLTVAAEACPELKAFLNTLLVLSGGETF